MLVEGQYSGYSYNVATYRGAAQYILDAFQGLCEIGHEYRHEDIDRISQVDLVGLFFDDLFSHESSRELNVVELLAHVDSEREIFKMRFVGSPPSMDEWTPATGSVNYLLLEAALDFIISLEMSEAGYAAAALENKEKLIKADDIIRRYGEQIGAGGIDKMRTEFYAITSSGKYSSDLLWQSVAVASLNSGWNGVCGWMA